MATDLEHYARGLNTCPNESEEGRRMVYAAHLLSELLNSTALLGRAWHAYYTIDPSDTGERDEALWAVFSHLDILARRAHEVAQAARRAALLARLPERVTFTSEDTEDVKTVEGLGGWIDFEGEQVAQ